MQAFTARQCGFKPQFWRILQRTAPECSIYKRYFTKACKKKQALLPPFLHFCENRDTPHRNTRAFAGGQENLPATPFAAFSPLRRKAFFSSNAKVKYFNRIAATSHRNVALCATYHAAAGNLSLITIQFASNAEIIWFILSPSTSIISKRTVQLISLPEK